MLGNRQTVTWPRRRVIERCYPKLDGRSETDGDNPIHLEEGFIAALEHLRDPTFQPDAGAFKDNDAELNRIFGEVMKGDAGDGLVRFTTITHRDIRATQRLWIVYRDAWVALAAKVRPDIPSEVLKSC